VGWAACPSQQQDAGVRRQPAPLAGGGAAARLCPELNPTEALWGNLKGKGGELAYLAGDTSRRSSGPPSVASTGFAARPTCPIRFYLTPDWTCRSTRHSIQQNSLSNTFGATTSDASIFTGSSS